MSAGQHKLPELPYAYDALEPHIDEQTMRLHHDKHHQGYVNGLNAAEKALEEARSTGDFSQIRHIERDLAFNAAGHFNHVLFWNNMGPADQVSPPEGALLEQINADFGSLDNLKAQFSKASATVEGSGWGMLVWDTMGQRLETVAVENHQRNFPPTTVPILVLDVWEHAYYLRYQNKRGDYVTNWWNVVNWSNVADNFEKAKALKW
jgi:Fe-Mn family superoxide dismutase